RSGGIDEPVSGRHGGLPGAERGSDRRIERRRAIRARGFGQGAATMSNGSGFTDEQGRLEAGGYGGAPSGGDGRRCPAGGGEKQARRGAGPGANAGAVRAAKAAGGGGPTQPGEGGAPASRSAGPSQCPSRRR